MKLLINNYRFPLTFWSIILLVFLSLPALQAQAKSEKTYFLKINTLKIKEVLPPPPANKTSTHKDNTLLKDAMAASTTKQFSRALMVTHDTVFNYSQVLGRNFNAKRLPLTAALFKKATNDTKVACTILRASF